MASTVKKLRLVAYVRVSTDGQVQDGFGLDVQKQAVTDWSGSKGYRIVQWCTDEGVSGATEAIDREGLSCAIDAIEHGQADAIVVPRLDRLARQLTTQEAVLAHVWNRGGRFFAVDTGEVLADDPDDPMRTAIRQMAGVFAQLDRAMINKRLRDGRRVKASQGGYVAGAPPFGWRAEGRELVPDEAEQATLARMVELRNGGASLRGIAVTLNADGVKSKRGAKWSPSSVSRAIDPHARKRAREGVQRQRARGPV